MDREVTQDLIEGARALGLALGEPEVARFARYLDLLRRWNARINLTTVAAPRAVVERHFLDSLAVLPFVAEVPDLIDVGSGAGFPGMVLAAARPDLAVTLVESIHKKAAFLEAVKRELGLSRVVVRTERMEDVLKAGDRFGAAVSRATFPPAEWIARGTHLVAPGGCLIAMVVPGSGTDAAMLAPHWSESFAQAQLHPPYAPGRALLVFSDRLPRST